MRGFCLPGVNAPNQYTQANTISLGGRHDANHDASIFTPIQLTKPLSLFFLQTKGPRDIET